MSTLETPGHLPLDPAVPHAGNSTAPPSPVGGNHSHDAAAAPATEPSLNGVKTDPAAHASANGTAPHDNPHVQRAEEMVDRVAERVAAVTSRAGRFVVRLFSRVKEEAEDIWSEAQSIRRGDQP